MIEAAPGHARLQELVAGFADGELSPDQSGAIQEHLRTCARCRRELTLQQSVSRALARDLPREDGAPLQQRLASARLRRQVEQIGPPAPAKRALPWSRRWAPRAAAALVLIGAAGGTMVLRDRRGHGSSAIAEIPVVRDAVSDCRRAMARNFPRKADLRGLEQGFDFPIRPLDAELFSTWKTTLAGAPAAGLAYRWRGTVVVQYVIRAEVIRQQPQVDESVRRTGFYAASDQGQGILAFVAGGSGTLLVGDAPPEELRQLVL